MRYFDLHCDTIYESLIRNIDIDSKELQMSLSRTKKINSHIQCFAICVPEEIRGELAKKMFIDAYNRLIKQCDKFNISIIKNHSDVKDVIDNKKRGAIFTVENCSVLANDITNIKLFKDFDVKFATLTWNGKNELGAGSAVSHSNGLTKFGNDVVKEFDSNNIFIDVSHTSDRLFYDIVNISTKPIVATHSNSRKITNVKRNLTDKQFEIIKNKKGIVGLNFYKGFLNDDEDKANSFDILRHAEHFLSLGGEDILSIGADFDGCHLPDDINGIENIDEIYELFLKHNYNEALVKKIFYKNAYKFTENFDKY